MCIYIFNNKRELKLSKHIHSVNTRYKGNFNVPFVQKSVSLLSLDIMGLRIFNKVPYEIKEIENMKAFKQSFKQFLINVSYHSLLEYFMYYDLVYIFICRLLLYYINLYLKGKINDIYLSMNLFISSIYVL